MRFLDEAFAILAASGKPPSQLEPLRQALVACVQADPPDHAFVAECISDIEAVLMRIEETAAADGMLAVTNGNIELAENQLRKALEIARLLPADSLYAIALVGMGRVLRQRTDLRAAVDCYRRACDVADQLGDLAVKSGALDNLGNVYQELGQLDDALAAYQEALNAARQTGDAAGELTILNNLAMLYQARGELVHAKEAFRLVIDRARAIGRGQTEAIAVDNLAGVLEVEGELDEAERLRLRALELCSQQSLTHDEYIALTNLSALYMRKKDVKRAAAYFRRAADLIRRLRGDINLERYTTGRLRAVRQADAEGRARLKRKHGELGTTLQIVTSMVAGRKSLETGSAKLEQHRYDESERDLKLALAMFREVGAVEEEGSTAGTLGTLYMEIGEKERARQLLLHARQLAHKMGNLFGEFTALLNLARLNTESPSRHVNSLDLLTQAELLIELGPEVLLWEQEQASGHADSAARDRVHGPGRAASMRHVKSALLDNTLGNLYRSHGCFEEAEKYYLTAIEGAREEEKAHLGDHWGPHRLLGRLLNLLTFYRETNQTEKLLRVRDQIEAASAARDPKGQFDVGVKMGDLLEQQGEPETAYGYFKQAIAAFDLLRAQVPNREERVTYLGYVEPPYERAIALAVRLGRSDEAFDLVEASKSRYFIDLLAQTMPRPARQVPADLLAKEQALTNQLTSAARSFRDPVPEDADDDLVRTLARASHEAGKIHDELDAILTELATFDPEYVSLRRGRPRTFSEIREVLSNA
jgi:tetratricopeptide (TPR) repeat protein